MSDPRAREDASPVTQVSPRTTSSITSWSRFAVGLLLIIAAIWVVATQGDSLRAAWGSIQDASPWHIAAVLLLPLSSMVITTTIFWLLTRRLGRVSWWEMSALIGSAWLLNMLPFKPGLIGRIAYHKAISGIPIAKSIAVVVIAMVVGTIGIALTLLAVAISMPGDAHAGLRWLVAAGAMLVAIIATLVAKRTFRGRFRQLIQSRLGELGICLALRIIDTLLWALRYQLAFELIGVPADYRSCIIFAGVSQIAGQMPVQLGLREWTVGIAAGIFGQSSATAGNIAAPPPTIAAAVSVQGVLPGLQADLLTRAAEIACALPIGIISYFWIAQKLKAKSQS
ncbi:MAG: lysylphosphatidylglycerol synthase domain-containing protein [Phycisphaerales bacterium]|nr:lysylphosphatidylglycerol synthase domain-containing protein [Phycisphaerales bacterium]